MKFFSFPFPLSYLFSYLVNNKLINDKFHRSIFLLFSPLLNPAIYICIEINDKKRRKEGAKAIEGGRERQRGGLGTVVGGLEMSLG